MTCKTVRPPNGAVAIVCYRERRRPPCQSCAEGRTTKLCDFPTGPGKTCSKRLCDRCAVNVGPDLDYCPNHNQGVLPL